jgi:hypothetical protein
MKDLPKYPALKLQFLYFRSYLTVQHSSTGLMPDAYCMDSCCVDEVDPAALEVPVWVVLLVFGWVGFLDLGRSVDQSGLA